MDDLKLKLYVGTFEISFHQWTCDYGCHFHSRKKCSFCNITKHHYHSFLEYTHLQKPTISKLRGADNLKGSNILGLYQGFKILHGISVTGILTYSGLIGFQKIWCLLSYLKCSTTLPNSWVISSKLLKRVTPLTCIFIDHIKCKTWWVKHWNASKIHDFV